MTNPTLYRFNAITNFFLEYLSDLVHHEKRVIHITKFTDPDYGFVVASDTVSEFEELLNCEGMTPAVKEEVTNPESIGHVGSNNLQAIYNLSKRG